MLDVMSFYDKVSCGVTHKIHFMEGWCIHVFLHVPFFLKLCELVAGLHLRTESWHQEVPICILIGSGLALSLGLWTLLWASSFGPWGPAKVTSLLLGVLGVAALWKDSLRVWIHRVKAIGHANTTDVSQVDGCPPEIFHQQVSSQADGCPPEGRHQLHSSQDDGCPPDRFHQSDSLEDDGWHLEGLHQSESCGKDEAVIISL